MERSIEFESKGTIQDSHKGNSGHSSLVTIDRTNIATVRNSTFKGPKQSPGCHFSELGNFPSSLLQIMKTELKQFPYIHQQSINYQARTNKKG